MFHFLVSLAHIFFCLQYLFILDLSFSFPKNTLATIIVFVIFIRVDCLLLLQFYFCLFVHYLFFLSLNTLATLLVSVSFIFVYLTIECLLVSPFYFCVSHSPCTQSIYLSHARCYTLLVRWGCNPPSPLPSFPPPSQRGWAQDNENFSGGVVKTATFSNKQMIYYVFQFFTNLFNNFLPVSGS